MNLKSILLVSAFAVAGATHAAVVINKVYGGGGSGSQATTFKYDYVELFNNGTTSESLTGLSLQYAAATNTSGFSTANTAALPNFTLPAGHYYLIQTGSATTSSSPGATLAQDFVASLNLSATTGKLLLFSGTTGAGVVTPASGTTQASSGVRDFVGFGTANQYEGAVGPAPTPSVTSLIQRAVTGLDTNNNATDFVLNTAPTADSFHNSTFNPVPEPSAFAALGLGAMALIRRRRKA